MTAALLVPGAFLALIALAAVLRFGLPARPIIFVDYLNPEEI